MCTPNHQHSKIVFHTNAGRQSDIIELGLYQVGHAGLQCNSPMSAEDILDVALQYEAVDKLVAVRQDVSLAGSLIALSPPRSMPPVGDTINRPIGIAY